MTWVDITVAVVAVFGFLLAVLVYFRDKDLGDKTADLQQRIVEIEEERHGWEVEERAARETAARLATERAQSADLRITFAYRQSSRSTGRVIARNEGQATATGVLLEIWGEVDGERKQASVIGGANHKADRLQKGEAVHIDVPFTFGSPRPEDLRYRVTWTDQRGGQELEGRVPVT